MMTDDATVNLLQSNEPYRKMAQIRGECFGHVQIRRRRDAVFSSGTMRPKLADKGLWSEDSRGTPLPRAAALRYVQCTINGSVTQ